MRSQRRGSQPQTLSTSLLDPVAYTADKLARLHHERRELERGFDEIKPHTLEREQTLCSRTPERCRPEVREIATAYNLVRLRRERMAEWHQMAPSRVRFRHTLTLVRGF